MKRRSLLELSGTATLVGTAGCTQLTFGSSKYRLWFLRVHNGTPAEQSIDIRVRYDGTVVYEQRFEEIPSFRETEHEKAAFAAMESARLIENEWNPELGTYSIEYRLNDRNDYEKIEVADIEEFDAENVGVNVQLLGGSLSETSVGFRVLGYESKEQATQFLTTVTNQTEG